MLPENIIIQVAGIPVATFSFPSYSCNGNWQYIVVGSEKILKNVFDCDAWILFTLVFSLIQSIVFS